MLGAPLQPKRQTPLTRNTIVLFLASLAFVRSSAAQQPIRVETKQVLVPVYVGDKQQLLISEYDSRPLSSAVKTGDMARFQAELEKVMILNLTAADFQVFDDGKEQKVQNVSSIRSLYWNLRDNKGHHTEYIGGGGGKWSTTEWQDLSYDSIGFPHYVLAYSLPESPPGSCHKIQVKVTRRNAVVASRTEYCNIDYLASDPLNGSKLGKRLQDELTKSAVSGSRISVSAIPFYRLDGVAQVDMTVEWCWKSLKDLSKPYGILGLLYKDGDLIGRFSDLADRDGSLGIFSWVDFSALPDRTADENRYERQIKLSPGNYELRVALGDGSKFGKAIVPFKVERANLAELAISQVAVCKLISDMSLNAQKLPGTWTATLPETYAPLVSNETEFYPTNHATFKVGESLYVYFEIYVRQRDKSPQGGTEVEIRIVNQEGKTVSDLQPIAVAMYAKPGNYAIPIGRGIDISEVSKGSYRIEARGVASNGTSTAWSGENFTVE